MRQILLSAPAEKDLKNAYLWGVEHHGQRQADAYQAGLKKKLETLASFPKLGAAWRKGSPIRTTLYGKHRIFYRIVTEGIEIGRVIRAERSFLADVERYERYARLRFERRRKPGTPRKGSED